MGLFDRIFGAPSKQQKDEAQATFSTLTAYTPVFTSWNGMLYESELCRSAIDAVARHASKLKVELVGAAQPQLKTLIKHKPNQWMTWSQFLYRTSTILWATNSVFIVPILNNKMETTGFFPVLPERVELREFKDKIYIRYTFGNGKVGAIEYDRCAILTRYQYDSDFFGSSNRALDDTLALIHLTNQGIKEAVKNSASYRFIGRVGNFAKAEDLKKERVRFTEKNFSAEAKANNGILLFPSTYTDIKQIDSKPYNLDDKQMNFIRQNVERYFGVNEKVICNTANGEELDAFFNGVIEPLAIQLSESMSKAIYTDLERSFGSACLVLANRLQYMSTNQKVTMAKELGDRGYFTIDEVRELFNMEPLPDGLGQKAFIRGEYYPLDEKVTTPGGDDGDA